MNESISVFDEPSLAFAGDQAAVDPHDGLALFGAYTSQRASPGWSSAHILLATEDGLPLWDAWAHAMNRSAALEDVKKHRLWPPYPGFEICFGNPWTERAIRRYTLDKENLLVASRKKDPHERCFAVVEQLLSQFASAKKLEPQPKVAICVIPDEVWTNCRTESRIADPSDQGIPRDLKESRRAGQRDFLDDYHPEQYRLSPDFRRQLKARTMQFDIPVQIIRQSTLRLTDTPKRGERGLTPLSDRMWNLSTTLFYKCDGKPWKLNGARPGVCYIGIAFRRASEGQKTACCAAQMFLDSGDGIVFLGDFGPWYSPEKKEFHLSTDAARQLLTGVLATYNEVKTAEDPPLNEIFLHSRSQIGDEEFKGYQEACPANCKVVGIRVRSDRDGPRLFRIGSMPILRGTFWRITERFGYLFGTGFKPRIATYDGWETPIPMRIDIQHGQADIDVVARDIFALTKLNYNACRLGSRQPVTVKFSDDVGEILIANPTVTDRRHNFKYYI
jgi:hypothetical protein